MPKIAHQVNYLAHRKMGTMIIKNRQFRSKFLQKWLTPKGKSHSSTPKIDHPVNYLSHRKMGTMIIKNRQFRSKFLPKWLTPKGRPHSSTSRMGNTLVLSWNWSISKFVGQYQHSLKLLFMKSYNVYQPMMALKGWHISKFSGENTLFGLECSKFEGCPPS